MDTTGGDLSHAAKELEENIERQQSHDKSSDVASSKNDVVGHKPEQHPHSSGSSSEDVTYLEKLDSNIVKVPEIKKGEEAYAHLPENEKAIVKRQLDIPTVTVTFKTLYRYATRNDLIIIAVSCICAIAGGAVMPLMTVSTRACSGYAMCSRIIGHLWSTLWYISRFLPRDAFAFILQLPTITLHTVLYLPCHWRIRNYLRLHRWIHIHRRAYCGKDS